MITRQELDIAHAELSTIGNLIAALDLIIFDLCGAVDAPNLHKLRDAVIGITEALNTQYQKADAAFETLYQARIRSEAAA